MKNLAKTLIIVAAIVMLIAVISRLTIKPVMGLESRAMGGFAALLLLFAIALQGQK
jgi:hypothetical protein